MSERIRVRLILARLDEGTEPCVIGAIDEAIWEHWNDEDESDWRKSAHGLWGFAGGTTYREVWAEFPPQDLVDAYETPVVHGHIPEDDPA